MTSKVGPWITIGAIALGVNAFACASQKSSVRLVSDPTGESVVYGPPVAVSYEAELDAGREYGVLTLYRSARCDVIPVTVMQTYKETLHGDKVVERSPTTKTQVAGEPDGSIVCDQTYARDVEVFLEAGGDRFSLGKTNAEGQAGANLAQVFKVGSFEELPEKAKIMVRPEQARPMVEVGEVSLARLGKFSERVTELLDKLSVILQKGETDVTGEDIARSYEIYAQLQELAPNDPRVTGASARFWELQLGRKKEESRERMGKTLEALSQARSTLKVMGDAAIPLYVQAAVSSGTLDKRALEWASLRLLRALRGAPSVCSGGFAWAGVPSYGWPADARLAAQYVNYARGGAYAATVQGACRTF